jgi:hypothetical protein
LQCDEHLGEDILLTIGEARELAAPLVRAAEVAAEYSP